MGEVHRRAPTGDELSHVARLAVRLLGAELAVVTGRAASGAPSVLGRAGGTDAALAAAASRAAEVVHGREPLVLEDRAGSYAGWPVRDEQGRVVGVLGVVGTPGRAWDGTDTAALADLARAASAEIRLRLADAVLAATDVGLAVYDDAGRLVLANERARWLADAAGDDLGAVWPAEPDPEPQAEHTGADALRWVGPAGDRRAVLSATAGIVGPGGEPHVVVGRSDVTPLARALEVEERFVATVSHELRTPLTAILGYLELLVGQIADGAADDPAAAAQAAVAARVERAALTLQARVADLLDGAARRRALDLRRTDLGDLLRRVVDSFVPAAAAAGLTLTVEPATHPATHPATQRAAAPVVGRVDGPRVEQAVENLVANSLKYTPAGGRVDVRLRTEGDRVVLEVADTGVGMTAAEVELAFQQYWRSADARAGGREGAGLGLPLVRQIATEHRGHVRLRSTPGGGTVATLSLPREPDQEHTASGSSPTSPRNTAATREV